MSERITIEGGKACLTNGRQTKHQIELERFITGLCENTIHGLNPTPIPSNVKWHVECGSASVTIVELKPEVRWVRWISKDSPVPYGPDAVCVDRLLATPYVIVKVPIRRGRIIARVEVFFRNEPLESLDGNGGKLYWPNLLNVSPYAYGCTAWFCTQFLGASAPRSGLDGALNAVVHHLWGSQFNASSEAHEGASTFSMGAEKGLDARVTEIERWEAASKENARFPLDIAWLPTDLTVRRLIETELDAQAVVRVPNSAAAVGNILLRKKPK